MALDRPYQLSSCLHPTMDASQDYSFSGGRLDFKDMCFSVLWKHVRLPTRRKHYSLNVIQVASSCLAREKHHMMPEHTDLK